MYVIKNIKKNSIYLSSFISIQKNNTFLMKNEEVDKKNSQIG